MNGGSRGVLLRVFVFVGVTWALLAVLGAMQVATEWVPAGIVLPQLAPGLAALITLVVFRRDAHRIVFALGSRPVLRVVLAVTVPLAIAGVAFITVAPSPSTTALGLLALVWIPIGALGEEVGWRGYLNPVLSTRFRGLTAAVITGALWVPFHVGLWHLGPVRFALFGVGLIAASVVVVAIVGDARFSVTLATLFHGGLNVGSVILGASAVTTMTLGVLAAAWIGGAVLVVVMRPRLFLHPTAADLNHQGVAAA
jgi:membrane protease YdiL (CAAX protease family)